MGKRFVLYGLAGLLMEVFWNGFWALVNGNHNIVGSTSLWMFPIYGSAVMLEYVHEYISNLPTLLRGGIYTLLIFTAEFISGWIFIYVIGVSPWDYSGSPYSIYGLIRLDFAPAWFAVGLLFEKLHNTLISIEMLRG